MPLGTNKDLKAMNIFAGNSLWQLVVQSDLISKFVLLLLLGMSVICWTIFLCKLIILRIKKNQFKNINKKMMNIKSIPQLLDLATTYRTTTPGYFLSKNLAFLKEIIHGNLNHMLTNHEWELLEHHIENSFETILIHNESYLTALSSCAAVAPLLGLFGTVWGLIHSFMRISESQVADITTVAPGIAEALITTLAGLIVAIPALAMFNYLQTDIRSLEYHLTTLANRLIFSLQQLRKVDYYAHTSTTIAPTESYK